MNTNIRIIRIIRIMDIRMRTLYWHSSAPACSVSILSVQTPLILYKSSDNDFISVDTDLVGQNNPTQNILMITQVQL
jgi:hypothetical protein